MPVFATPNPIWTTIELYAGVVQVVATDRADTSVEVRPTDDSDDSDVKAAEQTRAEYSDGRLTIRGPRSLALNFSKKTRSVDVLIELPAGSRVHTELTSGELRSTGALAECRFKASVGHLQLDRTGALHVETLGHIVVDTAVGDVDVSTGSGRVQIGAVEGNAAVKNSNGDTEIGTVTGDLRARASNGSITVARADGGVDAKSSNGIIRVGEVSRDSVTLLTATGDLEVGIAEGTAAWLDLKTGFGRVRNELDEAGTGPGTSERTVEVRAHTSFGDITVRRS